ncbi:uncharacterized protein LOC107884313 [Acyrthosiphon pisum]|uniref:Uncharacterized protein n=1 Tax=Acyrthosiphon pisum TaxID=7029 RepID=A0A8R2D4V1_ACYPI|nr:uncharacterized protein LOC107884313 [Acyrthosiphon pisum]|eukprot:XP_016661586.1 PREDICTED: uncharacterized protein LOC107884313 isoform X1 [Acyrthosiphon pisum]
MYNPTALVTHVHTDASSVALSGVLFCLKLYAVIWMLDRLRQFLLGIRFTVLKDCQSLNVHKTTGSTMVRSATGVRDGGSYGARGHVEQSPRGPKRRHQLS